jgi:inner membrane protein involved in colicin E2 resistance
MNAQGDCAAACLPVLESAAGKSIPLQPGGEHPDNIECGWLRAVASGRMLSLYVGKVLESRTRGLGMAAVFAVLYGLLYMILSLEDYALLAGALLGFAALTTVMFATLRIDWSGG